MLQAVALKVLNFAAPKAHTNTKNRDDDDDGKKERKNERTKERKKESWGLGTDASHAKGGQGQDAPPKLRHFLSPFHLGFRSSGNADAPRTLGRGFERGFGTKCDPGDE